MSHQPLSLRSYCQGPTTLALDTAKVRRPWRWTLPRSDDPGVGHCQTKGLDKLSSLPEGVLDGLVEAFHKKRMQQKYQAVLYCKETWWNYDFDGLKLNNVQFLRLVSSILVELKNSSPEVQDLLFTKIRHPVICDDAGCFIVYGIGEMNLSEVEKDSISILDRSWKWHVTEDNRDTLSIDINIKGKMERSGWTPPSIEQTIQILDLLIRKCHLLTRNGSIRCSSWFGMAFNAVQSREFIAMLQRIGSTYSPELGIPAIDLFEIREVPFRSCLVFEYGVFEEDRPMNVHVVESMSTMPQLSHTSGCNVSILKAE